MDASRFKRRQIQTVRQIAKPSLGGSVDGLRAVSARRPSAVPVQQVPSPPPNPIDMGLPGQESLHWAGQMVLKHSLWRNVRTWAFRGLAVVLIAVVGIGGLLFSQGFMKLHKVFRGTTGTAAALKANVDPALLKGEGAGRINLLVLGRGGGNHDGPDLTDTMMLASIDPVNHTSVLISIPRDLWVKVNGTSTKINAAWETGEFAYLHKVAPGSTDPKAISAGFDAADQVVEDVLGINIHYNLLVDFQAFQQGVDTVGGVTVNVPTDLVDPTMAWENANNPVLAKAGVQAFDGKHALIYVRSRETTSDFARGLRQRSVLLALKAKVDSLGTLSNPLKIASLMNTFGNNVQTDLSLGDASRLYSIVKNISETNTSSSGFTDPPNSFVTTAAVNGQSTVQPKAGMFNYSEIQNFIKTQLKDGYITKENAKVLVLNGTTLPGLATAKADELKQYGYNVIGAASTPTSGWTQTMLIDLSHGQDKYTRHYLEQRFKTTAVTTMPDNTIQTNGADFVIIVGSDEANSQ